jgi:hypothetical protein
MQNYLTPSSIKEYGKTKVKCFFLLKGGDYTMAAKKKAAKKKVAKKKVAKKKKK